MFSSSYLSTHLLYTDTETQTSPDRTGASFYAENVKVSLQGYIR